MDEEVGVEKKEDNEERIEKTRRRRRGSAADHHFHSPSLLYFEPLNAAYEPSISYLSLSIAIRTPLSLNKGIPQGLVFFPQRLEKKTLAQLLLACSFLSVLFLSLSLRTVVPSGSVTTSAGFLATGGAIFVSFSRCRKRAQKGSRAERRKECLFFHFLLRISLLLRLQNFHARQSLSPPMRSSRCSG